MRVVKDDALLHVHNGADQTKVGKGDNEMRAVLRAIGPKLGAGAAQACAEMSSGSFVQSMAMSRICEGVASLNRNGAAHG